MEESSSSSKEMAMAPVEGSSEEESSVEDMAIEEDTAAEEEAPCQWRRKHPEGQISSKKPIFYCLIR